MVEAAAAHIKKINVSFLILGFMILARGTSSPEQVIFLFAAFEKQPDIFITRILNVRTSIFF